VSDAPAKRRLPLALIGVVLLLVAAVLIAVAVVPHRTVHIDSEREAATACRNFEDVYGATRPGTPMNGQALASKLDQAIEHMHKAASGDAKWKTLAGSLDDVGRAVNAGDAPASYAAMQDVHNGCAGVAGPATGNA
jgi:hypothetical protein